MTPKQAAFVDEYLVDFNATQAAIRAGYSERSAYNMGWRTLQNPRVAITLERRLAERGIDPVSVGVGGGEAVGPEAGAEAEEAVEVPRLEGDRARSVEERLASFDPRMLNQRWVLGQLVEIVDRCMREVPVRDRAGRETGEWTFKPREALSALTLIGKHLGMFSARLDVRFLREQAEAVAAEYDLDPDEVVAEAQKWLDGQRS